MSERRTVEVGRWTRMRSKSVRLVCAMVVTTLEGRPDGRNLTCVAVKSVPGRDSSVCDVRQGTAVVSLSGDCGLEGNVGLVMFRYLYLDSLAYSDLGTRARKAYGKFPGRPNAAAHAAAASVAGRSGGYGE